MEEKTGLIRLTSEQDVKTFLENHTPEDIKFEYLFISKRRNGQLAGYVFQNKRTALPARPLAHSYNREDVIRFLLKQIKKDEVYLARPNDFKDAIVISFEIRKRKDVSV